MPKTQPKPLRKIGVSRLSVLREWYDRCPALRRTDGARREVAGRGERGLELGHHARHVRARDLAPLASLRLELQKKRRTFEENI